MTQLQFLQDADVILAQAVFWAGLSFVAGVSTFWPWWKTDLGWTIVVKTLALALLLLPYNLHLLLGVSVLGLPYQWLATIAFALVLAMIIWRFIVIWVIQRYDPPPTRSGRFAWGSARLRWAAVRHERKLQPSEGEKIDDRER